MRPFVTSLVFVALTACASTRPPPDTPVSSSPSAQQPAAPGEPPANCDFKVAEACHATEAEACKAAGCAANQCRVRESYPAQVSCG